MNTSTCSTCTTYNAGGVTFADAPIMIGAGVCKNPQTTKDWLQVAPVVSGSYTPCAQKGNEGNVIYPETEEEFERLGYALNSYGMPNMGISEMVGVFLLSTNLPNPLIVSIAGRSVQDYINGVLSVSGLHGIVFAIELNLGCPNDQSGVTMSFDSGSIYELCRALAKCDVLIPVWLKFSPYTNVQELKKVACIVNDHSNVIKAVVVCNTIPNAFAGKGKIDPNGGLAGLSGPAIKQFALGQVVQFKQHLTEVDVIGVGGITIGDDVIDFLDAGAAAVQLVSMPCYSTPQKFWEKLLDAETGARLAEYLSTTVDNSTTHTI